MENVYIKCCLYVVYGQVKTSVVTKNVIKVRFISVYEEK